MIANTNQIEERIYDIKDGKIQEGSPTVTADGKAVARIGDSLTCGCIIVGGGNTVGGGANG